MGQSSVYGQIIRPKDSARLGSAMLCYSAELRSNFGTTRHHFSATYVTHNNFPRLFLVLDVFSVPFIRISFISLSTLAPQQTGGAPFSSPSSLSFPSPSLPDPLLPSPSHFPSLHSYLLSPLPFPPLPSLRTRTPKIQLRGLGSIVSSPIDDGQLCRI